MWLLLCREAVAIFGFWAELHCLLLFLSGSQSSVLVQLPHLCSPLGTAGPCSGGRQCRGALGECLGRWGGVPRGGEGPRADVWAQPRSPGTVVPRGGEGLAVPPARLWQMPAIARVFLALPLVSEGTRNISCPGSHRG